MFRQTCAIRAVIPAVKRIQDKLLINGQFVSAISGKTIPVVNPATEETIAHVAEADAADVDLAVKAAREVFEKEWKFTDGVVRRNALLKLADLIKDNAAELATLESMDNGKPYAVALAADVKLSEECIRFYAGCADKIYGELAPVSGNAVSIIKRQPVGVCGQVVPWNFPLLMAAWKLGPALAMGNTVVLKPAEQTPLTALRIGELCLEAGFPAGVVNVLPGYGATAGAALARHMDVDKVAFTGSTAVGREIMRMAAESNIKKVSLELGGKSALIICEDADLDRAANVANQGIYFNMGQVCTASSRMFVHESIHDAFIAKLKAKAENHKLGPGTDTTNDMGPLVSKRQHERVLEYINIGREEGASLVTGGNRFGEKGYFVQPTIFSGVKDSMRIAQEEIFGPVTCVMKFRTMDEVVARANNSVYGLAAGIVTESLETAMRYSTYLDAGTVWVNTWNTFDVAQPFGGFKESGLGRELGKQALDIYTEYKTIYFSLKGPIVKN